MTPSDSTTQVRRPWWRERWVSMALLITVAQVALFWALSPPDTPRVAQPPRARDAFVLNGEGGCEIFEEWLWLMSPAIFMAPSRQGFSGAAWLNARTPEAEIEQLTAQTHPMPYQPVASVSIRAPLLPRQDLGLASQWRIPPGSPELPKPPPTPLPDRGEARIISGLRGWRAAFPDKLPAAPDGVAPPVVVRVAVDRSGGVAAPPIVWEGSGSAAVDEAAIQIARGLRFERTESAGEEAEAAAAGGLAWGLISIEWAAPAVPPDPS